MSITTDEIMGLLLRRIGQLEKKEAKLLGNGRDPKLSGLEAYHIALQTRARLEEVQQLYDLMDKYREVKLEMPELTVW